VTAVSSTEFNKGEHGETHEWTSSIGSGGLEQSIESAWIPVCSYQEVKVVSSKAGPPTQEITVEDLTSVVNRLVNASGVIEGTVTVVSRHTTTGITINEWESRLMRDVEAWLLALAPPDSRSIAAAAATAAPATPATSSSSSFSGANNEDTDGGDIQCQNDSVRYLHNDMDQRPESEAERQRCLENGWDVANDHEALKRWRNQEPINAHSHLMAMLLGSSETVPVSCGRLVIGQWQSIMLVDTDGPRDRTVGIQINGFKRERGV